MNEIIQMLTAMAQAIMNLPPEVMAPALVVVIGYLVRRSPIKNEWIPRLCPVLGAVVYPILASNWSGKSVAGGVLLGFAAWTIHKAALKQLETKYPALKTWLAGTGIDDEVPPTPPAGPGTAVVTLLLAGFFLPGCATWSPQQTTQAVQVSSVAMEIAAKQGTLYALSKEPNALAYFQAADIVLTSLLQSGNYNSTNLTSMLNTIPVTGIKNSMVVKAAISDVLDMYRVTEADVITGKLDQTVWLKPLMQAADTGIQKGIALYGSNPSSP